MKNSFMKEKIILGIIMGLIWLPIFFLFIQNSFSKPDFTPKRELVSRFILTDYCFSTESRHTRHLNFPELIAPFQDLPGGHDHFPSSSFLWANPQRFQPVFIGDDEQ